MKKTISVILSAILLLCSFSAVAADSYVTLSSNTYAKVVEVVDGDALAVQTEDGRSALVRLIGVDAMGNNAAYEFMTKELMGARVYLSADRAVKSPVDRWNKMYVYRGNELINEKLLTSGLAKINKDDINAAQYNVLTKAESTAMTAKIGVWNEGFASGIYVYNGDRVNINTASSEQLRTLLKDSGYTIANRIITYRDRHPFETVSELKFVNGITRDIYNDIFYKCAVSTNIAAASVEELQTLKNVTYAIAQEIVTYRARYSVSTFDDFYTAKVIPLSVLNANKPFVSFTDVSKLNHSIPNYTVNLNTATLDQLQLAGLSSLQSGRIISGRVSAYALKCMGEISNFDLSYYSETELNYLADNLHAYTDLNNASEYELRSLFAGSTVSNNDAVSKIIANRPYSSVESLKYYISADAYGKISPYLYVDKPSGEYVNINTATLEQLRAAGLSSYQANLVYNRRGAMLYPGDIPTEALSASGSMSIITNVNTATARELESLSTNMTSALISDILYYRSDQPFGSVDEFRELFDKAGKISVFNEFAKFISVR